MSSAPPRCLVVGAGLFGLAAAWALSRRGWQVLILEAAGAAGHEWSGSKGGARIFRLGYPEPHYADMARRAADLWRGLEVASGRTLLHPTGQLSFGDGASLEAVAAALATVGMPGSWLTEAEARARFPRIVAAGPVLFEPASGVLAADACLLALRHSGAFELRTRSRVTSLRDDGDTVTVTTAENHTLEADLAVVCAGPPSLSLLGAVDTSALAANPSLPQVAYFRPLRPPAPPVFIEWGDRMVYGLPVPAGAAHGGTYKVSHHTPGPALDFDPAAPGPLPGTDPALLAELTGAVRRLLPDLDPVPVATERCVYDNSADGDLVLGRVGHVVVGCGSSGHGFKFGPLIGELLADLAEDVRPTVDLGPFRLDRRPAGNSAG